MLRWFFIILLLFVNSVYAASEDNLFPLPKNMLIDFIDGASAGSATASAGPATGVVPELFEGPEGKNSLVRKEEQPIQVSETKAELFDSITDFLNSSAEKPKPKKDSVASEDDIFELLDLPAISDEEKAAILTIKQYRPNTSEIEIRNVFGSCLTFSKKLASCQKFKCEMPVPSQKNHTIVKEIMGEEGGNCIVTDKIVSPESKIISDVSCEFASSEAAKLGEALLKGDSVEIGKDIQGNCAAAKDKTEAIFAKKSIKDEARKVAEIKKSVKKIPTPQKKRVTKKKKKKDVIAKAKISILDKEEAKLSEDQLLSRKTSLAVDRISKHVWLSNESSKLKKKEKLEVVHGKFGGNIELSVRSADGKHKRSSEELIARAYRAIMIGHTETAIDLYKQVLKTNSKNSDALFGLATAYQRNLQYIQARDCYAKILKYYPDHRGALNNFFTLIARESPEHAIIELKKMFEFNDKFSPLPAQIGIIYLQQNSLTEAEKYLKRAISLEPENLSYQYNLAIISDKAGKYQQATYFYNKVLENSDKGFVIPVSKQKVSSRLGYLQAKIIKN